MHEQSRQFFERYDYFILPVTQVAPFDVTVPYPTSISGTPMATYIDWMRSCWYVTFMSSPAISVPGGFTPGGLPVGVQIVGRHRGDWSVLQLAHAFEQATRHGKTRPRLVTADSGTMTPDRARFRAFTALTPPVCYDRLECPSRLRFASSGREIPARGSRARPSPSG